jgi:carbon monoxide dehydrogenase subunit G
MKRKHGASCVIIGAPVGAVWRVVSDPLATGGMLSLVRTAVAVRRDDAGYVTLADVKIGVFVAELNLGVAFAYEPEQLVEFQRVSGDLHKLEGSYRLRPLDRGRTQVDYEVSGEFGFPLDQMVRGPIESRIWSYLLDQQMRTLADAVERQRRAAVAAAHR